MNTSENSKGQKISKENKFLKIGHHYYKMTICDHHEEPSAPPYSAFHLGFRSNAHFLRAACGFCHLGRRIQRRCFASAVAHPLAAFRVSLRHQTPMSLMAAIDKSTLWMWCWLSLRRRYATLRLRTFWAGCPRRCDDEAAENCQVLPHAP